MSNSQIHIRAASQTDARFVAEMVQLSLHHLGDHLFGTEHNASVALIERLLRRDAGRFGLRFAFLAEVDGSPNGMLFAHRGDIIDRLNLQTVPHLFAVMGFSAPGAIRRALALPGGPEAEADEYYVGNVGVPASAQGLGVGSALLAFAEDQARREGLGKCALIVGLYNQGAFRLYQRLGYQVVETVEHPEFGYHRMVKVL